MPLDPSIAIAAITPENVGDLEAVSTLFGRVFDESETYCDRRPSPAYLKSLLSSESFIAFAAKKAEKVVGGVVAYELKKFEQERSELYIYDLAVDNSYRRQGVATALIEAIQATASKRGAWVVYVQADQGDAPAIALYSKLGRKEDVHHFDLPPKAP